MGLNSSFHFTVVLPGLHLAGSLTMVFICGMVSLIITLTKVRKMIIESIPGLCEQLFQLTGVFLAYGIKNAGLAQVFNDPGNYTEQLAREQIRSRQLLRLIQQQLQSGRLFNNPAIIVALVGLAISQSSLS